MISHLLPNNLHYPVEGGPLDINVKVLLIIEVTMFEHSFLPLLPLEKGQELEHGRGPQLNYSLLAPIVCFHPRLRKETHIYMLRDGKRECHR